MQKHRDHAHGIIVILDPSLLRKLIWKFPMFSYLHRYHAGSFADVHKHLILIELILSLQKKATPFAILDTHAGEGIYDLKSIESQKNTEFKQGLSPLLQVNDPPPLLARYLDIIQIYNTVTEKHYYPGSPAIIKQLLRAEDRAILIEGHPRVITTLRENFGKDKQLHIHERDSLEGLNALIPFKEKRGLIFMDPSYEVKTEYKDIVKKLTAAFERFPQGVYALWYPLLPAAYHQDMLDKVQRSSFTKVWYCEWIPYPQQEPKGLYGSGMVILNTPWQLDIQIKTLFTWLNKHVYKAGHFQQRWI